MYAGTISEAVMTGCCPNCNKDYFYLYMNSKINRNCIPEYMRIEDRGNNYTIIATCQKCKTEFRFYDGSY